MHYSTSLLVKGLSCILTSKKKVTVSYFQLRPKLSWLGSRSISNSIEVHSKSIIPFARSSGGRRLKLLFDLMWSCVSAGRLLTSKLSASFSWDQSTLMGQVKTQDHRLHRNCSQHNCQIFTKCRVCTWRLPGRAGCPKHEPSYDTLPEADLGHYLKTRKIAESCDSPPALWSKSSVICRPK